MAKYFMETLVGSIEKEFDTDVMIVQLETLKNVLGIYQTSLKCGKELNVLGSG